MPCTEHLAGANPRMAGTCVRCGRRMQELARDLDVERELTLIAGQAAGVTEATVLSLDQYAEQRAHDGPVRVHDRDLLVELAEELADARNYAVWEARRTQPGLIAGDHEATCRYDRALRTLAAVQRAWREFQTDPS